MSDERVKRPAFQWYPGDWRRDTALQSCSIEARGLWIEMINLMHDGEPYGHLTAGGVAITAQMLGTLAGIPVARARKLISELEGRRILSRTADGVIYSRRMVRDEGLRVRRAAGGKLGGNPLLVAPKDASEVHGKVNHGPTPAVAVAVASAVAPELLLEPRVRFCVAANKGLEEHATRPQRIPMVLPNSGKSYEATEFILGAGVPVDFAESAIYEKARTHNADGDVSTLKYFTSHVVRMWAQHQASNDVAASELRPNGRTRVTAAGGGARNDAAIDRWLSQQEAAGASHG